MATSTKITDPNASAKANQKTIIQNAGPAGIQNSNTTKVVASPNSASGVIQKGLTPYTKTVSTNITGTGYNPMTQAAVNAPVNNAVAGPDLTLPTTTPSKLEKSVSDMNSGSWQPTYSQGANGQTTSTDPQTVAYMNWVSKQAQAGVDSSQLTPDMFTASGMAENANQSSVASQESQGLTGTITSEDIKRYGSYANAVVQKRLLQNQSDQTYTLNQNSLAAKSASIGANEENKQAQSAISSVNSQFANNRNGLESSGNAQIASQFSASTQAKLDQNSISRQMAQNQRDQTYQQLLDAQASGNDSLAQSLASQVSAYDTQIQQAKAEQQKLNDTAVKDASAMNKAATDKVYQMLNSNPAAFMDLTPTDISNLYGVDLPTAAQMSSYATLIQKSPEYAGKILKQAQDMRMASMDSTQKQIQMAQNLMDLGQVDAANKILDNLWQGGSDYSSSLNQSYQNDTTTMDSAYADHGVVIPTKTLFAVTYDGNGGINVTIPTDANGQSANGRTMCGAVVNDYLGVPGFFKDSAQQKESRINTQTPVPGSVFIMRVGTYDHVGIVTDVNADGSIDIIDSNRDGRTGKVATGNIKDPKASGIVGYYNPILDRQGSVYSTTPPPKGAATAGTAPAPVNESASSTSPAYGTPLQDNTLERMAISLAEEKSTAQKELDDYTTSLAVSPSKVVADKQKNDAKQQVYERAKVIQQNLDKKINDGTITIKDLPSDLQQTVQGLLDYSGDITSYTVRNEGTIKRAILGAIHQIDPSWTTEDFTNRQDTVKAFIGGKEHDKIESMATLVDDVNQLADANTQMNMGTFKDVQGMNSFERKADDVNSNLSKIKELEGEQAKAAPGVAGATIKTIGAFTLGTKEFTKYDSFENSQSKINDVVSSMLSSAEATKNHWESIMKKPMTDPIFSKQNIQTLKSLHTQGYINDTNWDKIQQFAPTPKQQTISHYENLANGNTTETNNTDPNL